MKKLKYRFFNWLTDNKFHIDPNYKKSEENKIVNLGAAYSSGYTLGGSNSGLQAITLNTYNEPAPIAKISLQIAHAVGGTIIDVSHNNGRANELYVIPDGADFDTELGKIITMSRLKQ